MNASTTEDMCARASAGEPHAQGTCTIQSLRDRLDRTARENGYRSYANMCRRLNEGSEALGKGERFNLLKLLAPTLHDLDHTAHGQSMPMTDATGLVAIAEIQKSLARLIRVLLLGYTSDELGELADRMKAERAQEVDSGVGIQRAEANHSNALERLEAAATRTCRVMP